MIALTVKQPWAELIASGRKIIELRSWRTHHRGPLLITSSAQLDTSPEARVWQLELGKLLPTGVTVCAVDLVNVDRWPSGGFGWLLARPRRVDPLHVRGQQGLWRSPFRLVNMICMRDGP